MSVEEAADYTGYSVGTLNNLRTKGGGPIYSQPRAGGRVLYDPRDLDAWLDGGRRKSTRDDPAKRPRRAAVD